MPRLYLIPAACALYVACAAALLARAAWLRAHRLGAEWLRAHGLDGGTT